MTLFALAEETPDSAFARVLEQYYRGERDGATLRLLQMRTPSSR
jgi:uncharacterized protein (DUF1810 family)